MNCRVNRTRCAILGVMCGLAIAAASHAQTSGWGYLEYAGRRERGDGQPDTTANYATVRLNGSAALA
jgi:hypothetical protein